MTRTTRTGRNTRNEARDGRAHRHDLRRARLRRWGAHLAWRTLSFALSLWLLWALMAWVESLERNGARPGVAAGPPAARALVFGLAPTQPAPRAPTERSDSAAGR